MFRKLSLILLAVIVSSGNLLAADWAPAVTSSATYKLTSSGSGNKFYVNGGTTAYDGIATFNLNSGKTINIEFNTSKPVNVNGIIKVTNGILNLSIGNDYSGVHSTLKRGTRAGDLICVQNSTATQSSCKLTITGNEANEFMIHGNSTFAVTGTDATGYSVTADEDQKHRGVLVDFYGGVLTMEYVKLCNNYNNSTNNNLKFGSAIRHYEKENAPYSTGEITLTNCTIQDCYSENAGTALVLRNEHSTKKTTVTMTGCTIMRCFCEAIGSSNGGIIRTWAASFCTLKMEKCAIKNNKSKSNSCIAWNAVQTDPIQLIDDTISGNWTSGRGCGIWISGLGTIEGCVISGNYCKNYGGGLCYTVYTATNPITDFSPNNGTLTLDANTTISGNTAEGNGGGVYFQVNPLNIGNTTYYKNSEGEQYECSLVIDGATISGNKSLKDGGGIYLSRTTDIYKSNLEVKAGNIKDNQSGASGEKNGGGIYINSTLDGTTYGDFPSDFMRTDLNIIFGESAISAGDLTVTGNKANNGGGAYITGVKLNTEIYNGTFGTAEKPNLASTNGGGLYVSGGDVTIEGGNISYNVATNGSGGGLYSGGGDVKISKATISYNKAEKGNGGGLYSAAAITVGGETEGSGATISGTRPRTVAASMWPELTMQRRQYKAAASCRTTGLLSTEPVPS